MPASAWIRPLVIAAVVAFIAGVLGLMLNQPRLAPIGLFIGVLLTILAAIAWNTPRLPLFSETRPLLPATADAPAASAESAILSDETSTPEPASGASSQDNL